MRIIIEEGKERAEGLPEGNAVIFLGKRNNRYCIVFGLKEKIYSPSVELFDGITIGFGREGEEMRLKKSYHGHKYEKGAMIEVKDLETGDSEIIFFQPENEGSSYHEGRAFDKVFVVE